MSACKYIQAIQQHEIDDADVDGFILAVDCVDHTHNVDPNECQHVHGLDAQQVVGVLLVLFQFVYELLVVPDCYEK